MQLKQSNLPLALYLLNEQFVREKHVLGHTCDGIVIKSGQEDTEASINALANSDNDLFSQVTYDLFTQRRGSKDYKRSLQRQVLDEVLRKRASKERELTQIIKHSLKAICP